MKNQHTILVCSSCASHWQEGKKVGVSGGQKLLEELTQLSQTWPSMQDFLIQPVECMSACSHACVVAFAAPNKYTYLFGDLAYSSEQIKATTTAVLNCASLYFQKPDGLMPWSERPELLKKGIIARIPSYL